MEGNEIPFELSSLLSSIQILAMVDSQTSSSPLFSCIITLYTLILIFYPCALKIFLSPVLIFSSLLLLCLLRLGALQRLEIQAENKQIDTKEDEQIENRGTNLDQIERNCISSAPTDKGENHHATGEDEIRVANSASIEKDSLCLALIDKWVKSQSQSQLEFQSKENFENSFVEWNVRAPLEVIYEAYEGEEDDQACEFSPIQSLSMYYPETDSDCSSDDGFPAAGGGWDSPESLYMKWEEEDKEGMLIEIALDSNGKNRLGIDFHFEEDNLIEIDISPRGNDSFNAVLA